MTIKKICAIVAVLILFSNFVFFIISYIRFTKSIKRLCGNKADNMGTDERKKIYETSFDNCLYALFIFGLLSLLILAIMAMTVFEIKNFVFDEMYKDIIFKIFIVMFPTGIFFAYIYDSYLSVKYYIHFTIPRRFALPSRLQDISCIIIYSSNIYTIMLLSWLAIPPFINCFGLI